MPKVRTEQRKRCWQERKQTGREEYKNPVYLICVSDIMEAHRLTKCTDMPSHHMQANPFQEQ